MEREFKYIDKKSSEERTFFIDEEQEKVFASKLGEFDIQYFKRFGKYMPLSSELLDRVVKIILDMPNGAEHLSYLLRESYNQQELPCDNIGYRWLQGRYEKENNRPEAAVYVSFPILYPYGDDLAVYVFTYIEKKAALVSTEEVVVDGTEYDGEYTFNKLEVDCHFRLLLSDEHKTDGFMYRSSKVTPISTYTLDKHSREDFSYLKIYKPDDFEVLENQIPDLFQSEICKIRFYNALEDIKKKWYKERKYDINDMLKALYIVEDEKGIYAPIYLEFIKFLMDGYGGYKSLVDELSEEELFSEEWFDVYFERLRFYCDYITYFDGAQIEY